MKKYKVLFATTNIGSGHVVPAQAIKNQLEKKYGNYFEVRVIDLLKVTDMPVFRDADHRYAMVTEGRLLQKFNNALFRLSNAFTDIYQGFDQSILVQPTWEVIDSEQPDLVIANHPDCNNAVGGVRAAGGDFCYMSQITDSTMYMNACMDKNADYVICPTEDARLNCLKYGIPPHRLISKGFTLRQSLKKQKSRNEFLHELGLEEDKPIIMITSGGMFGFKSVIKAVGMLSKNPDWQTLVLCGHKNDLRDQLEYKYRNAGNVKTFGFMDNIQDFYNIADIVIAKPGMSTAIETEAFGKRTIFTRAVALQERGNVNYALKSPLARYINTDWDKLVPTIEELLTIDLAKVKWQPRHHLSDTEKIVDEIVIKFQEYLNYTKHAN